MKVLVEQLNVFADDRGSVFEPLKSEAFKLQRNAHVVISLPGVVRGNHYHRFGTEVVAVKGPSRVCFRKGKAVRDVEVPDKKVFRFTIPPNISHAIQNTGKESGILMAFNTIAHDPENSDTVEDVLIPVEPVSIVSDKK
ncbi:MAG: WxcM-like domain-containing protein [Deltaproteobacteria bacterium]|nr:WxcM-like domain-containing protein [Deltaproteobacteria bacterium]